MYIEEDYSAYVIF